MRCQLRVAAGMSAEVNSAGVWVDLGQVSALLLLNTGANLLGSSNLRPLQAQDAEVSPLESHPKASQHKIQRAPADCAHRKRLE